MAASFEEVFTAHRDAVHALCVRLLGSQAAADDAVQETFLAVHEGLSGFRGQCQLRTWLFRIAFRVCLRLRARPSRVEEGEGELEPAAPGASPEDVAAWRHRARQVRAVFATLSSEHQVVLALSAEGHRHPEIAEVLGIPEGTVWSRLHLARKRLLKGLEERGLAG